ncbi:MAG TPA: hypothetical protein GXZ87_11285 [Bacteroidales bacterium]|nr:hypothetical protein [Bacteroidales bacterium]
MNIVKRIIRKIRSKLLTRKFVSGTGEIRLATPFYKIKIIKEEDSVFELSGKLTFMNYYNGNAPVYIHLGKNSRLIIDGDFIIGDGVKIIIDNNAELVIGGGKKETASGITSNTLIMVYKRVTIGKDFMCSWNVYITDCDWHSINNSPVHADVKIGDHVWVGNNCSILKGSVIGNNSIVTSYSKVINKTFEDSLMIGGIPAKELKKDVFWNRDIK